MSTPNTPGKVVAAREPIETLIEQAKLRRQLPPPPLRRALREQAGLSKSSVGAAIGVSAMAILHWERGTRRPNPEHLAKYAALLRSLQHDALETEERSG
jgi:DNA-binding transcriptional regulator YiaG